MDWMRLRLLVPALLVLSAALVWAYAGGPPDASTAAPAIASVPAEGTCLDCHDTNTPDTGGSLQLLDVPALYREGRTYTLTVRLASSQTAGSSGRTWGFQLTAVRMSNGAGAGTFANVAGQGTQIISGGGSYASRRYIEQSSARGGQASPVEWLVDWTAPGPNAGAITFYAAGVAGNGGQGSNNDWVYTASVATQDTVTPVLPASWGRVKAHYRR